MNETVIYNIICNNDILDYIFNFITPWSIGQYGLLSVCTNFRNTIKNKKFIQITILKYKNIEPYILLFILNKLILLMIIMLLFFLKIIIILYVLIVIFYI